VSTSRSNDDGPYRSGEGGLSREFGFNVIGYVSGNLGLGVSARHITKLLLDRGLPTAVLDLNPGLQRAGHDRTFDSYQAASPELLPYAINLAFLPMPAIPDFFLRPPPLRTSTPNAKPGHEYWFADGALNVAVVWWELTILPPVWVKALELFDVVIAPSSFIRSTLDAHLSNVTTISASHPLYCPSDVAPGRSRFGLPEDDVLFLTMFEPFSDPVRKNPVGVVRAFKAAFADRDNVKLVIKTNNAQADNPTASSVLRELQKAIANDPRILVFANPLSYAETLSLYASCDVFVSLHRSEGLGLGLMEAMALGKPVIATGWSGNMTYMDHFNSCLVRYELVPVHGTIPVYQKTFLRNDSLWAEPDVADAVAWMRRLVEYPEERAAIGSRASLAIAKFQEQAEKGSFIAQLEAIRRNKEFLPRDEKDARLRIQALASLVDEHRYAMMTIPDKARRILHRHLLWRFRRSPRRDVSRQATH
jgi:glycosyltransferase involved in cell wall biosynthesis